jgi:hypothetical protein
MSSIIESAKLDKSALRVFSQNDPAPDRDYWLQKTPEERLSAIEYLRVLNYGEAATSARLQRILTIARFGER